MLASDVSAKLTALGLTTGYVVIEGKMPHTPNKVIALTETGGSGADQFLGNAPIENPSMQLRVRGEADDYNGPRLVIERIFQALTQAGAFTQGARYLSFTPLQSPFLLKRDENVRCEFAVNFLIMKELSTT